MTDRSRSPSDISANAMGFVRDSTRKEPLTLIFIK